MAWASTQAVVALTAYAMKEDQDRCMDAGMDGYLPKPIQVQELDALLETHLARLAANTLTRPQVIVATDIV